MQLITLKEITAIDAQKGSFPISKALPAPPSDPAFVLHNDLLVSTLKLQQPWPRWDSHFLSAAGVKDYPLVIEHSHGIDGPFIDDFPNRTTIYRGFCMAMLNNQMVVIPGMFFRAKRSVHHPLLSEFWPSPIFGLGLCHNTQLTSYDIIKQNLWMWIWTFAGANLKAPKRQM